MPSNKDSMKNILVVALSVCFVCAVIVSTSAVMLKPIHVKNATLNRNKNILIAAGLYEPGKTSADQINELFQQFDVRVVDLQEGRFLSQQEVEEVGIDVSRYDQRKASKDPSMSMNLSDNEDVAQISRRARYSIAYLLRGDGGDIERIVLPVHGYGLWSTLYGFIALQGDGNTVTGITFYEHQETPGLGGEVDNPRWKASWEGKQIYDDDGDVALDVAKGDTRGQVHKVDALSGATLTSNGVENLIAFWMGENGFGPVLKELGG
ncbi:MAG: Na(+)-translocating NADH-quinone reductase subunit C [Pseudomonadales bacterium]|nr:Na(+)-translocating NADH-quinone reductase subunit C [Pseudomonadales bacterium]